ncbi:type II toxin-antitoxin system TacA family antitoxin [Raineya sp.]|jgi:uncharacterized protein (DUF1778 family)
MKTKNLQVRFDFRLSQEQKELMLQAKKRGNYKSLTDFVLEAIQEKANKILQRQDEILASERDCEVFFEALMNTPQPNDHLIKALKGYQETLK